MAVLLRGPVCSSQTVSARVPSLLASATEGHLARDLDPRSHTALCPWSNAGGLSFLCSRLGWLPGAQSPVCQPCVPAGVRGPQPGCAEGHFVRETLVAATRRLVRKWVSAPKPPAP